MNSTHLMLTAVHSLLYNYEGSSGLQCAISRRLYKCQR